MIWKSRNLYMLDNVAAAFTITFDNFINLPVYLSHLLLAWNLERSLARFLGSLGSNLKVLKVANVSEEKR